MRQRRYSHIQPPAVRRSCRPTPTKAKVIENDCPAHAWQSLPAQLANDGARAGRKHPREQCAPHMLKIGQANGALTIDAESRRWAQQRSLSVTLALGQDYSSCYAPNGREKTC